MPNRNIIGPKQKLTKYRKGQLLQARGYRNIAAARAGMFPQTRQTQSLPESRIWQGLKADWNRTVRSQQAERAAAARSLRSDDGRMITKMRTYNDINRTPGNPLGIQHPSENTWDDNATHFGVLNRVQMKRLLTDITMKHDGEYVIGDRREQMRITTPDGREQWITLSERTLEHLRNNIDEFYLEDYPWDEAGELTDSEKNAMQSVTGGGNISMGAVGGGGVGAGGWFKYYNRSHLDLKNFQIYSKEEVDQNYYERDKIKAKFGQIIKSGPNMQLLEWMQEEGRQIYFSHPTKGTGRSMHPATWEKAMEGVRKHKTFITDLYDFKQIYGIGVMIHEVVENAPFPFEQEHSETHDGMHEHCFIFALERSGVDHTILQSIKLSLKSIELPIHKLEMISKEYKMHLTVRYDKHTQHFPRLKSNPIRQQDPIKMGCLCNHFFLIEQVPITTHALKNLTPFDDSEWFKIYNQRGDKDEKMYTNSYRAIEILLATPQKYLTPIPPADLYRTIHYDKKAQIVDLRFLEHDCREVKNKYIEPEQQEVDENGIDEGWDEGREYCTDEEWAEELRQREADRLEMEEEERAYNSQLPQKKPKKDPTIFHNVHFDFETVTEGMHEAYLVNAEGEEDDEHVTFYTDDRECGRKLLDWIYKKYSQPGHGVRLIAHNCGYDYRFISKFLSHVKLIERGMKTLLRGNARYYFSKGR